MFQKWYKYQHHKMISNGQIVSYRYFYICIPYFLRNGIIGDKPVTEHLLRLSVSLMKIPGRKIPHLMHVSLPFGIWYDMKAWHRTQAS